MLKQQGVNVKGLLKGTPTKEEIPPLFDNNGKLEVIYPFIGFVAQFHLIRVSVIWLISWSSRFGESMVPVKFPLPQQMLANSMVGIAIWYFTLILVTEKMNTFFAIGSENKAQKWVHLYNTFIHKLELLIIASWRYYKYYLSMKVLIMD